jgi:hypothetical protein
MYIQETLAFGHEPYPETQNDRKRLTLPTEGCHRLFLFSIGSAPARYFPFNVCLSGIPERQWFQN